MSGGKEKKIRATSQDLMNYISRGVADQQLHFVIRCAGRLDSSRLKRAVDLCIVAQPVLGCLFVEEGKRPYWSVTERTEAWGYSETEEKETETAVNDFILLPGDPKKDPLAQVRLFHGTTDTVCIKMNHVCADAAGTRNYGYLLVSIYNSLGKDPRYLPNVDGRERGMSIVLKRYGPGKRFGFARAAMKFMRKANKSPGRSWQFPVVSASHGGGTMGMRRLEAERVGKIVEMAKKNGATLNDVLLTAYFRALFRIIPVEESGPVPLQVSADLRRYNPEEACDLIANLSSAIFAAIPPAGDETFVETLVKVKATMDRLKERSPLIGAYAIAMPFRLMNYRQAANVMQQMTTGRANLGVAMPLLSNFGKLEPGRLSFDGLKPSDTYITTPLMFPPFLMLGVTGYDGSLTFTSGYCREGVGNDSVEKMLDLVLGELP